MGNVAARVIPFLAAGVLLLAVNAAASWPSQPIRWIVPFPPGGGTDFVARLIGNHLDKLLGQPIIVENKPGGATVTGTAALVQAAPDGHTVGMVFDSLAINAALGLATPYDPERDIEPVIELANVPLVLLVNTNLVSMQSLPELISYTKANPGWLTFGTLGPGSPHEVGLAWLKKQTGMDALVVPYRGVNPALQDLVAGQIKAMFLGVAVADEFIRAGTLRPLGVSTAKRLKAAPNLPTIAEQGYPAFDYDSFYGLGAPRGTPPPILSDLNRSINEVLDRPDVRLKIEQTGAEVVGGTQQQFAEKLKNNFVKMKKIVLETALKAP
jgi:tripartite-type tricarboxylate transporter receptor subunit TctC